MTSKKWLFLVVYLHARHGTRRELRAEPATPRWRSDDSIEYFSTSSRNLAFDKADGWLEELEDGRETIDILRLLTDAPFTIERYDAIHGTWGN